MQPVRFFGVVGAQHRHPDERVGLGQHRGGAEGPPVQLQRRLRVGGAEMVSEGEGQSQHAGDLGAEAAGSQEPQGGQVALRRHRPDVPVGMTVAVGTREEVLQRHELLRKVLGRQRLHAAPQGQRRDLVRPGGPPDPQVDAARIQRLQHAELLSDHERRVVGEHYPARADPHGGGSAGDLANQHRRGGTGDPRHVVMLRHPVAPVAPRLDVAGQVDRPAQRFSGRDPRRHRAQIEDRKRN